MIYKRKHLGYPFRCVLCNRFISYKDMEKHINWTPHGGYDDVDPPDAELAHRHCWDAEPEAHKALIIQTAWLKPYPL